MRLAADERAAMPKLLTQEVLRLKGKASVKKEATLLALVSKSLNAPGRVIIFFSTKQKAHRAKILFGLADLPLAVELHGDMTQAARLQSLESFRTGKAAFLLATDVAARGLDILGVETVINYDAPRTFAAYLHRIGRTARAGLEGRSITFIEDGDRSLLKEIIKKGKIQLLSRKVATKNIRAWQANLESMERDVIQIHKQEREEKEIRKAEMEAQKAANMIEHHDEIYSRPGRTWFQTDAQKKGIAKEARIAALGLVEFAENKDKAPKNASKNAKRLERKQAAQAKEEEEKKKGKSRLLVEETQGVVKKVRALKAKEQELRENGLSAAQAGRLAASMLSAPSKKRKRKELFTDAVEKPLSQVQSKVYPGGAKSAMPKQPTHKLHGQALNKIKRGGKGKHSFKSKSKHKRR